MEQGRATILPALTGLRGAAALWVYAFHLVTIPGGSGRGVEDPSPGLAFLLTGWSGVDLFFILSGFALMQGYGDRFAETSRGEIVAFLWLRARRIYPVSLAALLAIILMLAADADVRHWYAAISPYNLAPAGLLSTATLSDAWVPFPSGWNLPTWSLSVELLGYACFPILARRSLCLKRWPAALAVIILCLAGPVVWSAGHDFESTNRIFGFPAILRMASGFGAGIALHRLARLTGARADGWAGALGLVAAGSLPLLALRPGGAMAMPFAFAALIFSLRSGRGLAHRVLASRPARLLGAISFPFYLLQAIPLFAFSHHAFEASLSGWRYGVGAAALTCLILALAVLLHVFVERPLSLKRSPRRAGRVVAAPPRFTALCSTGPLDAMRAA